MKFDRLKHSLKFVSNPGNRFRAMYHGVVQENGDITLVLDGYEDVKKRMTADAVGTDLPSIIARATAGDPTAWRQDKGFFGDIVGMPKTYAEILNTVNDAKAKFESLPLEVRQSFDSNFEKWFATMGSEDWYLKHGFEKKSEVKEEVKEE